MGLGLTALFNLMSIITLVGEIVTTSNVRFTILVRENLPLRIIFIIFFSLPRNNFVIFT